MNFNKGNISSLGKFDLETNTWKQAIFSKDIGRSFSIADYRVILNNELENFHYIIIAYGNRVEDLSKNFHTIKETKMNIDKIIKYFQTKNKNYIIKLFLMDADAPIKEDAKYLAHYIDTLSLLTTTESINLIGLSKCGAMSFYIPSYFQTKTSYQKTNLYTIATPFEGTKLASPKIFYKEIEDLIASKISDKKLSNLVSSSLINYYESISSNSHMDYDISVPNGIPEEKLPYYDSSFIKDMFNQSNLDAIKKLQSYKNILTGIDEKTLKEAIKTCNFNGIGLCLLDKFFFNKTSDGMVPVATQRKVEEKLEDINLQKHTLKSSHHDILSNERVTNDLLEIVNDTIEEQAEKANYQKKKIK